MSTLVARRQVLRAEAADVEVRTSADLKNELHWRHAFAGQRKDLRYFDLLEQTLKQGFDYRYFAIRGSDGELSAIQPFFILDQDMLAGVKGGERIVSILRRVWPRFLHIRTLMMGCAAGEGHLDGSSGLNVMPLLASRIGALARRLGARLIVLKEFAAEYRPELKCFEEAGFKRVP